MLYVDIQYAHRVGTLHSIRNFKYLGRNVWRFSCPLCGDSKKNKTKARGFLFAKGDVIFYKCHNCGKDIVVNQLAGTVPHNYPLLSYCSDKCIAEMMEKVKNEVKNDN